MTTGREPQLHVNHYDLARPDADLMRPIKNNQFWKPSGGLWTSTYDPILGSEWISVAEEVNKATGKESFYVLYPSPDAKIYVINCYNDYHRLVEKYPSCPPEALSDILRRALTMPDFERIAEDYDAIHLTAFGERSTRHPYLYGITETYRFLGWDCESTVWFRWKFDRCEQTQPQRLAEESV